MNNPYLKDPRELEDYRNGLKPDAVVICPMCKKNNARIFYNAHPMVKTNVAIECEDCFQDTSDDGTRYYEKNPTSIWKDQQGKEVAVDQRGNTFESPYKNREYDNHGWMQTTKKDYKKNLQNKNYL